MKLSSFVRIICCISLLMTMVNCCHVDKRVMIKDPNYLLDSTVAMVTEGKHGYYAYCAGVWISSVRFLTAKHCVTEEGVSPIGTMIRFKNRRDVDIEMNEVSNTDPYWGMVSAVSNDQDLALVYAIDEFTRHGYVKVSDKDLDTGDDVNIVGHTGGLQYTYLRGMISATRIERDDDGYHKLYQISTAAYKGNSGGGAFDTDGNLIGICSAVYLPAPNVVYFVHREKIVQFLSNL